MSRNTLTNLALRNQVLLDRYKAAQVLEFDKVHKDIDKAISDTLGALEVETLDELSKGELGKLLEQLRLAQTDVGGAQVLRLTEELTKLAGFTAKTEATGLQAITKLAKKQIKVNAATAKQAMEAALANPMNVGRESTGMLMGSFMKGWSDSTTSMVNGAVLQGWQEGKTVAQVMQKIRGTKAALYKDGILTTSRRDAAAMVRTATQHVAQTARMETWARNGDLVQGYEILATLDGRTTQICRSLDGRKYDLGKGPVPPFHVNCRTTTIPTLGPEFDFLDEGATRSSENGYVDANMTYYDWLKTQNADYVKDALGASRAKLFLEGGLSSKEFGDLNLGKNFEPMTLNDMAIANPSVFKATGLEKFIPDGIELLGELPVPTAPTKPDKWFEDYRESYRAGLAKAGLQDYGDESFVDKWKQLGETGYDLDSLDPGVRKQLQEVARQSYLPEQYIADAHWDQVKRVADMPVKIRVSEAAIKDVFSGGHLKNVHEVKATGATAGYNPSYLKTRTETEAALFNGRKPVYAYADTGHDTYQITGYGSIELELDRTKLKDATFTVGDSIDNLFGKGYTAVPAPISKPNLNAFPNNWLSEQFDSALFEVQVFDKVDSSLVKSVTLHTPNPSLQAFLTSKNVPFTLIP